MPDAVTENVAVWPAVTVWLVGCVVIEGVTDTPLPVIVIVATWVVETCAIGTLAVLTRCEANSFLVIKRLPETLPIADGAKLIVKVALCPPANVNGSWGPLRVKPPPDTAVLMSVRASVPEFVRDRV